MEQKQKTLSEMMPNITLDVLGFMVTSHSDLIQGDSFGTRPKKMRISQRLFIRF